MLRNSQNSQENNCASVSFLINRGLKPVTLLKKRLWHWCFPVNFAKLLRTHYFTKHLWATVYMKRSTLIIYTIDTSTYKKRQTKKIVLKTFNFRSVRLSQTIRKSFFFLLLFEVGILFDSKLSGVQSLNSTMHLYNKHWGQLPVQSQP